MKINWGTAIVLAIISFMTFILYLVVTMTTNDQLDHDLVTEEYYKQEIGFQGQLDKQLNAQKLASKINVQKTGEGFLISFPEELDYTQIEGKMFLYRPSNKQLDFEIPLSLSSHQFLVPDNRLVEGRWNIEIDWRHGQDAFFFEDKFTY